MKSDNWLDRVLANKDARVQKQRELSVKFNSPLLSLTLNIPGPVKNIPEAKEIFDAALAEIATYPFLVHERLLTCKETGCEALFALHVKAHTLKTLTCKSEETHPLGRFMDLDVIDVDGTILSRAFPRTCFVCDAPAKVCARSQKHPLQTLLNTITKAVHAYRTGL